MRSQMIIPAKQFSFLNNEKLIDVLILTKQSINENKEDAQGHQYAIINDELFAKLFIEFISSKLDDLYAKLFSAIVKKHIKSVDYSRKNEYDLAKKCLDDAIYLTEKYFHSQEFQDYVLVSQLPAEAYFLYKTGNFIRSKQLTIECIEVDRKLEIEHGFHLLQFHRLQQINNLARIEYKENNIINWIAYMKQIVDFLYQGIAPEFSDNWSFFILNSFQEELKITLLLQIINEVETYSIYLDRKSNYTFILIGSILDESPFNIGNSFIDKWLTVKRGLFLTGNMESFLQAFSVLIDSIEFLKSNKWDILIYSILKDIFSIECHDQEVNDLLMSVLLSLNIPKVLKTQINR